MTLPSNYKKPEEAAECFCPFNELSPRRQCLSNECMMWRWHIERKCEPVRDEDGTPNVEVRLVTERGYCGLAGKYPTS